MTVLATMTTPAESQVTESAGYNMPAHQTHRTHTPTRTTHTRRRGDECETRSRQNNTGSATQRTGISPARVRGVGPDQAEEQQRDGHPHCGQRAADGAGRLRGRQPRQREEQRPHHQRGRQPGRNLSGQEPVSQAPTGSVARDGDGRGGAAKQKPREAQRRATQAARRRAGLSVRTHCREGRGGRGGHVRGGGICSRAGRFPSLGWMLEEHGQSGGSGRGGR